MAELNFNTVAGRTIDREMMIAYLNTGERTTPVWSPLGMRVPDSSMSFDMSKESVQDILGTTRTTLKKPIITQSFDPLPLDAGDEAATRIWNLGINDRDVQALANQEVIVAHFYAGDDGANFAERYESCAVEITSLGGEGGGTIGISIEITYGGTRTLGTVAKTESGVTFTPNAA